MSVRDLVRGYQREIRDTADLLPDRAADILMRLAALTGNCSDAIREADSAYAAVLLAHLESETKANRARIKAEISPEYQRKQEARDTFALVQELIRSLKYFLRVKESEYQMAKHQ